MCLRKQPHICIQEYTALIFKVIISVDLIWFLVLVADPKASFAVHDVGKVVPVLVSTEDGMDEEYSVVVGWKDKLSLGFDFLIWKA